MISKNAFKSAYEPKEEEEGLNNRTSIKQKGSMLNMNEVAFSPVMRSGHAIEDQPIEYEPEYS